MLNPENSEINTFVSVIIPVFNRADLLLRCLESLIHQTYAHFEIIIVDDGSSEDIASAISTWTIEREFARNQPNIRVIRQANCGPASARNAGIFASTADIIAFIDSDCTASADWLDSLVQGLVHSNAAGIGGPIQNAPDLNWIVRYLDAAQFYRHRSKHDIVEYLLTASAAFTRSALLAVGGYMVLPQIWGEDADLSFRLRQQHFTLAITTRGMVTHFGAPHTLAAFARSTYRYGCGNAILSQQWPGNRHPAIELTRHLGAAILSPILAARLAKRIPLSQALSFLPIIVAEHASFAIGILAGWRRRNAYHLAREQE